MARRRHHVIGAVTAALSTPPDRVRRAGATSLFIACFTGLLLLLLLRSHALFTHPIFEAGDSAANSILTRQAKHFTLLTGHYSRVGFYHPGPAYLYVQAAGEWLAYDVTGIAPAPYNGQVMAIMALNSALVALALTILYSWLQSAAAVVTAAAVTLAFLADHRWLVSNTWMPYVLFPAFLLYLFAVSSVAAGRTRHLWIMVLAGGLLVHGHAEFIFVVPLLALVALIPQRRRLLSDRRHVVIASAVLAVLLLPIVLNEVLHWPGEIPKYLTYGHRTPNSPFDAARYALQFWGPGPVVGAVLMVLLFTANFILVQRLSTRSPTGQLEAGSRTFLSHLLRVTCAATVVFLVYCWYGVDDLRFPYIGIFSYALPLTLFVLGSSALVLLLPAPESDRWARRLPVGAAGLSLAIALVLAATKPGLVNGRDEVMGVPAALDYLVTQAHGRPIVLETRQRPFWPEALALVLAATRRDHRACLAQPTYRMEATPEFICTPQESASGARFMISQVDPAPPGTPTVRDVDFSGPKPPAAIIPIS